MKKLLQVIVIVDGCYWITLGEFNHWKLSLTCNYHMEHINHIHSFFFFFLKTSSELQKPSNKRRKYDEEGDMVRYLNPNSCQNVCLLNVEGGGRR